VCHTNNNDRFGRCGALAKDGNLELEHRSAAVVVSAPLFIESTRTP
jgi:hypothetical protein